MSYSNSFAEFEKAFNITFGDVNRPREAERELLDLRQGNKAASLYISEFQRLSTELRWSGSALNGIFYKGLNNEIKSALCSYDRPDNIEDFYELVARIDNRYIEFRQEVQN